TVAVDPGIFGGAAQGAGPGSEMVSRSGPPLGGGEKRALAERYRGARDTGETRLQRRCRFSYASDDDRDGAAVGAPRCAGDVARARGAKERDHGGDLVGLGKPPERAAGADRSEHLRTRLPRRSRL